MKKIIPLIVAIVVLATAVFLLKKSRKNYVLMDGVKYQVQIYNVNNTYSFYLFKNSENELTKWRNNNLMLAVACLEGASFIQDLNDKEMNELFEVPSNKLNNELKINAANFLRNAESNFGGLSLDVSVKITKVVSAKADNINYIIVNCEKIISNTPIVSTIILIDFNRSWKCMSEKRDPNGVLVQSLNRVSEEVTRLSESGEIKLTNGDF